MKPKFRHLTTGQENMQVLNPTQLQGPCLHNPLQYPLESSFCPLHTEDPHTLLPASYSHPICLQLCNAPSPGQCDCPYLKKCNRLSA